jgi:hypothetical protein
VSLEEFAQGLKPKFSWLDAGLKPGLRTIDMALRPWYLFCLSLLAIPASSLPAQTVEPNLESSMIAPAPDLRLTEPCRVEEVLPRVTLHVTEFVENVNRFTAKEDLEHERLDRSGRLKERAHSKSDYAASIERTGSGTFVVDEYRGHTEGVRSFQGTIEANLSASLVLIFLPAHLEEFEMSCAGPEDWNGHSTWRVHFQQRRDRAATMSDLKVGNNYYSMLLKGFAWIDRENYQIVHLETDLLQAVPELRLEMLHQSVDLGSVTFAKRKATFWLPQVAVITADFQGKRLVERHTYSKFRLFFVDMEQSIGKPASASNQN